MAFSLPYFTIADWHRARSCRTKVYYGKHGYAQTSGVTAHQKLLGEGRYILHKLAQLRFPDGETIVAPTLAAGLTATAIALTRHPVTLFEPVIVANDCLIRPDILHRVGDGWVLGEVRSKIYSSQGPRPFRNKRGDIGSAWRPALESLAFQHWVWSLHQSDRAPIQCWLWVPDRDRPCSVDRLSDRFRLQPGPYQGVPSRLRGITVELLAPIPPNLVLTEVDVTAEVTALLPELIPQWQELAATRMQKVRTPLGPHCKNCEFPAGFAECWGELAHVQPHVFDLSGQPIALAETLAQGKASAWDLPVDTLDERQLLQCQSWQTGQEWRSPQLRSLLQKCSYPLHFIDFETSRWVIPLHAYRPPYEQVAFQWSCHTQTAPDAPLQHQDWLDLDNPDPNLGFVRSLREWVGDRGTLIAWGNHENSVLRQLCYQIPDPPLQKWLASIVSFGDRPRPHRPDPAISLRILDLHEIARKHYMHPRLNGKTSLKTMVAAVWQTNSYLQVLPHLQPYVAHQDGALLSPYAALPTPEIDGHPLSIREGEEALLAYQDVLFANTAIAPPSKPSLAKPCANTANWTPWP
ncbi:MAG TPA: hypothetical protein DCQ32_03540 [Cyanobacteria bacterium UBA8156]|jgi:hypothetical protein|nr:hypothetical protein [Cyanobacteria bacterium UBA8156]